MSITEDMQAMKLDPLAKNWECAECRGAADDKHKISFHLGRKLLTFYFCSEMCGGDWDYRVASIGHIKGKSY